MKYSTARSRIKNERKKSFYYTYNRKNKFVADFGSTFPMEAHTPYVTIIAMYSIVDVKTRT